jgi:hypothetical protein
MSERHAIPWREVEAAVPELAAAVRRRMEAHRHLVMATIRADGAPRLCGTEVTFWRGDLWIGAMAGSWRVADLRRDPRIAIHSGSDDPPGWSADARVSGRAMVVEDEETKSAYLAATGHDGSSADAPAPGPWDLVRIDIGELAVVELRPDGTALVVSTWRPGQEVRRTERA